MIRTKKSWTFLQIFFVSNECIKHLIKVYDKDLRSLGDQMALLKLAETRDYLRFHKLLTVPTIRKDSNCKSK